MDKVRKYCSVNALFWEMVREDDRLWEDNWLEGLEKMRNWGGRCSVSELPWAVEAEIKFRVGKEEEWEGGEIRGRY